MKKTPFDGLYSLSDAAQNWGKAETTLRNNIRNGKFNDGPDVKKFGKQWIITETAMLREYGPPPESN